MASFIEFLNESTRLASFSKFNGGGSISDGNLTAVGSSKDLMTVAMATDGDSGSFRDYDNPRLVWNWKMKGGKVEFTKPGSTSKLVIQQNLLDHKDLK